MISVHFQGKPFNIMVIQAYVPISNAKEAEVERFYEDLHDFLELTPKKDVLFIIGDWNAKVGSQQANLALGYRTRHRVLINSARVNHTLPKKRKFYWASWI